MNGFLVWKKIKGNIFVKKSVVKNEIPDVKNVYALKKLM